MVLKAIKNDWVIFIIEQINFFIQYACIKIVKLASYWFLNNIGKYR